MPKTSLVYVDRSIPIEQMKGKAYDFAEDFISYPEGMAENINLKAYPFGFPISSKNVVIFLENQTEKPADVADLVFWAERFKSEERVVVALGKIFDFPNTAKPKRVVCLVKRSDGKRYLEFHDWNSTWPESCIFLARE
ncbi:MAG TPA: hypothetical protein P5230_02715 [Candidatus Magasanikbacteria bacterium]|nr:hypothetical protein [Candidatus Magasanikbacteria bacterium]